MSAQLARRLAFICSKRIAQLVNESGCTSPRTQSPMLNNSNNRLVIEDSPAGGSRVAQWYLAPVLLRA